jgi:protein-tyrosine phosphatase
MTKILFVCLGNICRSPTAHGVFQAYVDREHLSEQFLIDSAGTAAWHIGKSPDSRSQLAAKQRAYDLSGLKARQVASSDFEQFDMILAMDKSNLNNLMAECPSQHQGKLGLFLDYTDLPEIEVPDPYYGGESGFDHVLDLTESASQGLLKSLALSY